MSALINSLAFWPVCCWWWWVLSIHFSNLYNPWWIQFMMVAGMSTWLMETLCTSTYQVSLDHHMPFPLKAVLEVQSSLKSSHGRLCLEVLTHNALNYDLLSLINYIHISIQYSKLCEELEILLNPYQLVFTTMDWIHTNWYSQPWIESIPTGIHNHGLNPYQLVFTTMDWIHTNWYS
jgi:hypothetical protein